MLQRLLCTVACTMVAGCLDAPAPSTTGLVSARELFTAKAWPALLGCAGCHGNQPAIDFMAPGTEAGAYTSLFAFQPPVIDVDVPSASLLVTMGKHTGPALGPDQAAAVLEWLAAERDEKVGGGGSVSAELRVGPFQPAYGAPITLDVGIGGATLTVQPEPSETGLYLGRITLRSGSSTGLKVTHPLFVSRPAQPIVDDIDRFSDIDAVLAAGASLELGPAWFLSFTSNEYLSVHFTALEAP